MIATGESAVVYMANLAWDPDRIPTDAFNTYQNLTGATLDSTTGLLRLDPDQVGNLQSLFFHIGDVRPYVLFSSGASRRVAVEIEFSYRTSSSSRPTPKCGRARYAVLFRLYPSATDIYAPSLPHVHTF